MTKSIPTGSAVATQHGALRLKYPAYSTTGTQQLWVINATGTAYEQISVPVGGSVNWASITGSPSDSSFISAYGETLLDDVDAPTARGTLGVVIGTDVGAFAAQVSGVEITAGTEATLRTYSPADVKSFVDQHSGGGGDLSVADIDTIAELNAIVADATILVDGGALGTPSGGVATNLTGTASGLTAGTVTTNANLTGDVTSVGNATTIAVDSVDIPMLSATGTADGTTFLRGDNTWSVPVDTGDMVLASAQTNTGVKTFLDTTMKLRNVANTFDGFFTNTNTTDRIYTLQDGAGTIAFTSDITGTNSGTNTGDQTITLTGDVTGTGTGSFSTIISVDAVDIPMLSATGTADGTTFLRGDNTWSVPVGSGDMVLASAQTNTGIKTFLDTTMKLRNVANTFDGVFTNTNTADRIYTLQDSAGTIAFTSDITGTNSGTNTGDQTITLTGDVTGTGTGSFSTTIAVDAVDIAMLSATGTADGTTFLRGDNTWAVPAGGGDLSAADIDTIAELNAIVADATILVDGGALGTPASGTLTSCTGLPISTGVSGLATGVATFLGTSTLANLNTVVTDATLIDTGDSRLSDARTPTAHNHTASEITSGTLAHERGGVEADISAYSGLILVGGGATSEIKCTLNSAINPTITDDLSSGWVVGSVWINTTLDEIYMCVDKSSGAAIWEQLNAVGGDLSAADIDTIAELNAIVADATIIVSGGALGTPSSGVATNLTGTASGLTAGTVTTNANLTGDVTSVGNATTISVDAVDIPMLSAAGTADGTTFLRGDNTWANPVNGVGGGIIKLFDSEVSSPVSSIDTGVAGIAGGYDVLEVWTLLRTDEAAVNSNLKITVNNDTSNIYDRQFIRGANTTASAAIGSAEDAWQLAIPGASNTTGQFGIHRLTMPFYDKTTANKLAEITGGNADNTAANRRAEFQTMGWRSTAAITRMAITSPGNNFITGSRFIIFGRTGALTITESDISDLQDYFLTSNVVDEDNMSSDSDVLVPTQQSVKAYVDNTWATPGGGDSLTDNPQTVTTTDITGVVGQFYQCTIAGLTANRNLTLPSGSAGDRIGVHIVDGDDSFALIWKGASGVTINGGPAATEWSRGFIKRETVIFRCTATNTWIVAHDGRRAVLAIAEDTVGQAFSNLTAETLECGSELIDLGDSYNNSTYRFIARRQMWVDCVVFCRILGIDLGKYVLVNIIFDPDGSPVVLHRIDTRFSSLNAASLNAGGSFPIKLQAGDVISIEAIHNQGTEQSANSTAEFRNTVKFLELLGGI